MKKNEMNTAMESMTMPEVKAALDKAAEKYNGTVDVAERTKLELEGKELAAKYNALSLLTAYAAVMAEDKPILALAKAYNYPTVNFKLAIADALVEGKAKKVKVASVENSTKTHNLYDFLDWTAKHGKNVAASGDWKSKAEAARVAINNEWKKFMESEDGYKMSKTAVKTAVQVMFDALIFIPGPSGKNSVIAKNDTANYMIALAAQAKTAILDGKVKFKVDFMSANNWKSKAFDVLHMAVEGKTFDIVYGDPEEAANAATVVKAEPAGASKPKAKSSKKK